MIALLSAPDRPALSAHAMLGRLGGHRHHSRALKAILRRLESEGRIERQADRYRWVRSDGLLEVRLLGTDRAVDDAGNTWDLADSLSPVAPSAEGRRGWVQPVGEPAEGRAEWVGPLRAERAVWIGLYRRSGRSGVVTPYRDDGLWTLRVAPADAGGARPGEVVAAEVTGGDRAAPGAAGRRRAEGPWPARIVERIGRPGDPEADFRAVAWHRALPVEFPEEVLAEADAVSAEAAASGTARRIDLRDVPFVTIDPERARDHDDAVCVDERDDGFVLRVAIADVAHFVPEGSALDREALRRGNSVYFPDRAIPMLPPRLSSDLCSLSAGLERPAIVVELEVDRAGEVRRRRFHAARIESRARLVYAEAAAAMAGECDAVAGSRELAAGLRRLDRLAALLGARRRRAGSLDFELPAVEIRTDAAGRVQDLVEAERTSAHRAVEEAMLAANRAVGEVLRDEGRPAVYRVHDAPAPGDLEELAARLARLGWLPGPRGRRRPAPLTPERLRHVLARPGDPALARIVHGFALRAMKQARYASEPRPHFALGFETYVHFTSPIRRYADLVVHRALKARLAGAPVRPGPAGRERSERIAARLSRSERTASLAERDALELRKLDWLAGRLGELHAGRITGVARPGLFVRLDAWPVEGLVPARSLPPHHAPDPLGLVAVGPKGRVRFAVGDAVEVRLARVDRARTRLELALVGRSEGRRQGASSRAASSSARRSHSR